MWIVMRRSEGGMMVGWLVGRLGGEWRAGQGRAKGLGRYFCLFCIRFGNLREKGLENFEKRGYASGMAWYGAGMGVTA